VTLKLSVTRLISFGHVIFESVTLVDKLPVTLESITTEDNFWSGFRYSLYLENWLFVLFFLSACHLAISESELIPSTLFDIGVDGRL
jgi:hypothetical protein